MSLFSTAWWRSPDGMLNFGDEITTLLLKNFFEVEHAKTSVIHADLISTGSILSWIYNREKWPKKRKPIHVIGSGLMFPIANIEKKHEGLDFVRLQSVRGYLTKQALGEYGKDLSIGDPGLLSSLLYQTRPQPEYKFGLIPHHSQVDNKELISAFSKLGNIKIIDFRTDDFEKIFNQMLSCEVIISQSLHGLIMSDSFGIPNIWLDTGSLHGGGAFKFYDYFSSIDRSFSKRLHLDEIILPFNLDKKIFESSRLLIANRQNEIKNEFIKFFSHMKEYHTS